MDEETYRRTKYIIEMREDIEQLLTQFSSKTQTLHVVDLRGPFDTGNRTTNTMFS